jgi:cbb3-type cytochrome oxidase subunit 1
MKIKLIPKNEQDLSKVFIFLLPLTVVLTASINFLRDAFRSFSNVLPGNHILNYGLLDKIANQVSFNFLFSFILILTVVYLLSKSLGRSIIIFPLFFLTGIGIIGIEFGDVVIGFILPNQLQVLGNSSILIVFKILLVSGFLGLIFLNFLVKKEASIFLSIQFLVGGVVFYLISLLIYRNEYSVMSDNFFINSMYLSTHVYVGCSFVFLGILYFLITKGLQATLFSKTLGTISFWGYLFLLPWTGFKYFYGTTLPDWIENVSIYLSLSLIIPLLALVVNYSKTVATKENKEPVFSVLISFAFVVFGITNVLQIVSSISNVTPVVSLTNFEYSVRYGYMYSLILIVIPFIYYLVPKIYGREFVYGRLESFNAYLLGLSVLMSLFMNALIGINSGFAWNAGANAGNPTIYGEGFLITWSLISMPYTFNLFFSLLFLISTFRFTLSTLKAIIGGAVTKSETISEVSGDYDE